MGKTKILFDDVQKLELIKLLKGVQVTNSKLHELIEKDELTSDMVEFLPMLIECQFIKATKLLNETCLNKEKDDAAKEVGKANPRELEEMLNI